MVLAPVSEYAELYRQAHGGAPRANNLPESVSEKPAGPRAIIAAISWLKMCVIEGMAAYGEAMCPGIAGSPDLHADHGKRSGLVGLRPHWGQPTSGQAVERPTLAIEPYPLRRGIGASLAAFLSKVRPKRRARPTISGPETLDRWILSDIGLPPYL
jgi:hypothetical protein